MNQLSTKSKTGSSWLHKLGIEAVLALQIQAAMALCYFAKKLTLR